MVTTLTTILISIGVSVLTAIAMFIPNRVIKRKNAQMDRDRQLREEREQEIRDEQTKKIAQELLNPIMNELTEFKTEVRNEIKAIKNDIYDIKIDSDLKKLGLQAVLRSELYHLHDKCVENGFATREYKSNFENMYKRYETLGENGVMDKCYEEFMDLPESPVNK